MSDKALENPRLDSIRILDVLDGRAKPVSIEVEARALRDNYLSHLFKAAGKALAGAGRFNVRGLSRPSITHQHRL